MKEGYECQDMYPPPHTDSRVYSVRHCRERSVDMYPPPHTHSRVYSACKVEEGYECQEVPDSDKRRNNQPDRITGVCTRVNVCAMVVCACVHACMFVCCVHMCFRV